MNITGTYKCNDDGIYHITQINKSVWWFGEHYDKDKPNNQKPEWSNVAHGTINEDGTKITLQWSDVPKGIQKNHGDLTVFIKKRHNATNKFILTSPLEYRFGYPHNFAGALCTVIWR